MKNYYFMIFFILSLYGCQTNFRQSEKIISTCLDSVRHNKSFNKICFYSTKSNDTIGYECFLDTIKHGPYTKIHKNGIIEKGDYLLGHKYGDIYFYDSTGAFLKYEFLDYVDGEWKKTMFAKFENGKLDSTQSYFAKLFYEDTVKLGDSLHVKVELQTPTKDSVIRIETGYFTEDLERNFISNYSILRKKTNKFSFHYPVVKSGNNRLSIRIVYDNGNRSIYFYRPFFVKGSSED